MKPAVSIVVPVHNAVAYIADTLQSLRRQTVAPMEIVVVDDGSTDGTADVVRGCFPEVTLISQSNQGAAAARNAGIAVARGDLIGFVDADDRWLPHAVERLSERLRRSPESVAVAYAWSRLIDDHGRRIGEILPSALEGEVWATLLAFNFLGNASATIVRRSAIEAIGGFDPSYRALDACGCEDWEVYLRLAERFEFVVVPEYLVEYRKLPLSMTVSHADAMGRSHALMLRHIERRNLHVPWLARRFSHAIFYRYLAAENQRHGFFGAAGKWLAKAAWYGAPCTFLLPGFHACVIKQMLRVAKKPSPSRCGGVAGASDRRHAARFDVQLLRLLHAMLTRVCGQRPRQASGRG